MPRISQAAQIKPLPPQLIKVEGKGSRLLAPLSEAVADLDIRDDATYQEADELLAGIVRARREWKEDPGMYGTSAKLGTIPLQKQALDQLYDLNRRIDRPMEELEGKVRQAMRAFKLAEQRQLAAAEAKAEQDRIRLTEQLRETAEREQSAGTSKLRGRLAQTRERLESQIEQIEEEAPAPVQAAHSATRTVKRWRQTGKLQDILRAVLAGKIPIDAVTVDEAAINGRYRADVGSWPGFEEYTDVVIAARR